MDAGLVAAGKAGIEVLLKLKGIDIVLTIGKGTKLEQPGGGYKYGAGTPATRDPQRFALRNLTGQASAKTYGDTDTGVTVLTRQVLLTSRIDTVAEVGDHFETDASRYRIDELVTNNEFKKDWLATSIGPDPWPS